MGRLEHVSIEELHELLSDVDESTPTERILAAIAYKQGDSKAKLAERHDVTWKTIHNWLDRFEERPIEKAPYDEHRSGRPAELTDEQRERLSEDLLASPEAFGYDRHEWFPALVHHHIEEKFGIEYSLRHVRRLMNEAGLSRPSARTRHHELDLEGQEGISEYDEHVDSS